MKIVPKLAIAAASLTLGFAVVDAKSVSAAIINYAFTVDSPITKGNGFFSFDDSTLSNDYTPEATIQSLSFQFDGDSTVYTEQDDNNYPDFPIVFQTTSLTGQTSFALDYLFNDKSNPGSSISYEIIGEDFTIFSRTAPDAEPISGRVSYTQVPESTPLFGALFACSFGLMMKRKVTSIKKVKV
ncbi:PEP-CTERM sorting domain-containing protein [Nostoc sp. LEGE 12450]|uniref:PEP-CTERM sorting domain-containing protein n=1 Tax=Nostoc sp. LEGE 12450 TaxID=1828643 RepID=UPI001881F019|nr:PEP-CTERM sorting domain-containing protein [Nostoc sp. LEGE 12450]MBE8989526.1 PEP-CTERM sorting domain-containing protein [Nostoc sp. LEGE 12450]